VTVIQPLDPARELGIDTHEFGLFVIALAGRIRMQA